MKRKWEKVDHRSGQNIKSRKETKAEGKEGRNGNIPCQRGREREIIFLAGIGEEERKRAKRENSRGVNLARCRATSGARGAPEKL